MPMDKTAVWSTLAQIPIGTIVAWIAVIVAIIAAIVAGTIKLYQVFSKYQALKAKDEAEAEALRAHEEELKEIKECLTAIRQSLDEQKEVNLKQIRHTIVEICNIALEKGEISVSRLKSMEEMYEEYTDVFHANGYVKTLVTRVRKTVKIVGQLDE